MRWENFQIMIWYHENSIHNSVRMKYNYEKNFTYIRIEESIS